MLFLLRAIAASHETARLHFRYDGLPNLHLEGEPWQQFVRMNWTGQSGDLAKAAHAKLKDEIHRVEDGFMWGKIPAAADQLIDDETAPIDPTDDDQYTFKTGTMAAFKPDSGSANFKIRQIQKIRWSVGRPTDQAGEME